MIVILILYILVPLFLVLSPLGMWRYGLFSYTFSIAIDLFILLFYYTILPWDISSVFVRPVILPFFIFLALLPAILVPQLVVEKWQALDFLQKLFIPLLLALPFLVSALFIPPRAAPTIPPVTLDWPLEPGWYFISQGGAQPEYNHHYDVPAQRFALDVTQLYPWGGRALGLLPSSLDLYRIYGTKVLAPCAGEVLALHEKAIDQPVGSTNQQAPAGNFVALACSHATLLIAHLQPGIKVAVGERVTRGQLLG